jgi:DNA invertase Pin-like site-specific DNA recombinase
MAGVGAGDVLVVWKLDRLGRSLGFLIDLIDHLGKNSAGFMSLSDGIDTTTASGKLVFHIMGALAEFETSLISERTKAGMKAATRRGRPVGGPPKLTPHKIEHARQLIAEGKETQAGAASLLDVGVATPRRALRRGALRADDRPLL